MGYFDDFLATVPAEDKTILDKYPQLRSSISTMEQNYATAARGVQAWNDWQAKNWDDQAGMTRQEKALSDQLAAAHAKLETAVGSGDSATEVAALRKDFETKLAAVESGSYNAINGMNAFYGAMSSRLLPHQQEFGENLNAATVMKYMQENKINDPDVAYDRMFAGRRQEIQVQKTKAQEEKHAADLEAARKEGYDKRALETSMGPNGMSPTDQTGGIAGVTARIDKPVEMADNVKERIASAKSGDGSLATLGYELYKSGAFSGPVQ